MTERIDLTSRRRTVVAVVVIAVVVVCACSTTSPRMPERGLEGTLQDEAFWRDWTPRPPATMPVDERLEPVTVFDAWLLEEPEVREAAWDGIFHGLTALRVALTDREVARGVQALVMRLDAGFREADWEVAFTSHGRGDAEGIVLRLALPDGAGLQLEALRFAGGADHPDRWTARLEPAAEEASGVVVRWEDVDKGWRARWAEGVDAADPDRKLESDLEWREIIELWASVFWAPFTGPDYVEASRDRADSRDEPLAEGWPAALGREVRDRQLEDFVTDTVFPPAGDPPGFETGD